MLPSLRYNRRIVGAIDSRLLALTAGVPAAPTLSAAADGGYPHIVLALSSISPYATSHHIERSDDGSTGWAEIAEIPAWQTWYADENLGAGTTKYYRVRSESSGGLGSYSSNANATTFDIATVSGIAWWWEADDEIYTDHGTTPVASDNDDVGQIGDLSGNSHTFNEVSTKPKWRTNIANGHPAIQFSSGANMVSTEAASVWKFLHDQANYVYIWHIWKQPTLDPGSTNVLISTGNMSSSGIGLNLWYEDALPRNEAIRLLIGRGVAGQPYIDNNNASLDGTVRSTTLQITALRKVGSGAIEVYNNGEWGYGGSFQPGFSPSSSNPTYTCYLGRYGGGSTFDFAGYMFGTFVISSASLLSDATFQSINEWFAHKYGDFREAWWDTPSVLQHEASGKDHVAFGSCIYTHTGKLIVAYQKATSHVSQDADLYIRSRSVGGSWGSEIKLWDYATDGGSSVQWGAPSLSRGPDNTLYMVVGKRVSGAGAADGIGLLISSDEGQTWSAITTVAAAGDFTLEIYEGGALYVTSTGRWIIPHYGLNTGDPSTQYSSGIYVSDDAGVSWSFVLLIDGDAANQGYAEPGVIEDESNRIWALFRWTTSSPELVMRLRSADDGDTWDATPILWQFGNGLQRPTPIANDGIASLIRSHLTNSLARLSLRKAGEDAAQVGREFTYSPNVGSGGRMTYGNIAVHPDSRRMTIVYFSENSAQTISDAMIVDTL